MARGSELRQSLVASQAQMLVVFSLLQSYSLTLAASANAMFLLFA